MLQRLDDDVWTPKLVGDELVAAVKWAQSAAGPTGPAGSRSGMLSLALTSDERFLMDWPSIAEMEEFDPPPPMRRGLSPAMVSRMERILTWPMRYLDNEPGAARVLKVWVRCKINKGMKFDDACADRGWSRATAYRSRDKALSEIAQGLTRDGIGRGKH